MARAFQPTRKEKKRYIVYNGATFENITQSFSHLFGSVGLAKAGLQEVIPGILRVSHIATNQAKAALVWSNASSTLTSGSLKKAKEAL